MFKTTLQKINGDIYGKVVKVTTKESERHRTFRWRSLSFAVTFTNLATDLTICFYSVCSVVLMLIPLMGTICK